MPNEELRYWKAKFLELEGVDIYSAAGVAVSSLAQAVEKGVVQKDEVIMLNITGGGEQLRKSQIDIVYAEPQLVIDPSGDENEIIKAIEGLFV